MARCHQPYDTGAHPVRISDAATHPAARVRAPPASPTPRLLPLSAAALPLSPTPPTSSTRRTTHEEAGRWGTSVLRFPPPRAPYHGPCSAAPPARSSDFGLGTVLSSASKGKLWVVAVGLRQDASRREVIHFCVVSLLRAKMPSSNAPSVGDRCLSLQCTRTCIFAFAYSFAWTVGDSHRLVALF